MSKPDKCGCKKGACVLERDGDITRTRCQCDVGQTGKSCVFLLY